MEWSGDVDLNNGVLQQQYLGLLNFIKGLGLDARKLLVKKDLISLHCDLESNLNVVGKCK